MHKKIKIRRVKYTSYAKDNKNVDELDLRLIFPDRETYKILKRAGWLGRAVDYLPENLDDNLKQSLFSNNKRIWVGDTVMRGPIMFKRSDYLDIGGFDTRSFFLGNDDHCLCMRVLRMGKTVAFTPVHFWAPLAKGSERAHKTLRSLFWRELHRYVRADNLRKSEFFQYLLREQTNATDIPP
jgi:GT2 family glycosyltransferase